MTIFDIFEWVMWIAGAIIVADAIHEIFTKKDD